MFKKFFKKDAPDAENTDNQKPDTPESNKDIKKWANEALTTARSGFDKAADSTRKATGKTLKAAKETTEETTKTVKQSARKAADSVSKTTKSASESLSKSFRESSEDLKKQREARKTYPSSGSKMVDMLFPAGGLPPKAADNKPKPNK